MPLLGGLGPISGGTDAARRDMAEEALFLGQLLTQLLPDEPEALGFGGPDAPRGSEAARPTQRPGRLCAASRAKHELWDLDMIRAGDRC